MYNLKVTLGAERLLIGRVVVEFDLVFLDIDQLDTHLLYFTMRLL